MRIFLSYASEDRALANGVYLALKGAGYEVSYDRESLRPGDDFRSRLKEEVKRCDAFVFIATSHSIADGSFALTEAKDAEEKWPHPRGHLVTVRRKGVVVDDIPLWLREVTLLDEEGAGDLPSEVVRQVRALRQPRRGAGRRFVAGVSALVIVLFAWAAWRVRSDPMERALARPLTAEGVLLLADLPAGRADQAQRAQARMLEFIAIATRRTDASEGCDGNAAKSVANREEVRRALEFVRRPRTQAGGAGTVDSGASGGAIARAMARVVGGYRPEPRILFDNNNLAGMDLGGVDLRGRDFSGACLEATNFRDAALQRSKFNKAQGTGAVFTRARLDSSEFFQARLQAASFFGACLRFANLSGAQLPSARFIGADITWANFFGSTLTDAEGWSELAPGRTNALFLQAAGLSQADSVALLAGGASLDGERESHEQWTSRREVSSSVASPAAACDTAGAPIR